MKEIPKLLLTATAASNDLAELYMMGLVSGADKMDCDGSILNRDTPYQSIMTGLKQFETEYVTTPSCLTNAIEDSLDYCY